ncbi:thiamine pyrophosphate-dependent enzyme [Zhaonella formicivorans]|uniref:thiamine pyrophosphate-dependent enzyme n=1 Tax=Zhaonella formicivorans TaxID=2528593 RepID=UPI0010F1C9E9|nr:thiamine pyrophosphate-dependent enzyme [Zhaonella formicivorans]
MHRLAERPTLLVDRAFHYCPGCTHGIIHRLVAEVLEELQLADRTIGIASVGCSVLAYEYFDLDMQQAAHGRAPAVATGIKRFLPDSVVFTYQGDGDLASIGMAEIIHAAARGEAITVIFVNNTLYGMTGGQLAPTTLLEQKSTTSPQGRKAEREGHPIKVIELLSTLAGPGFLARTAVHTPAQVLKTRKAIKEAFLAQLDKCFALVEILSTCPTNWKLSPVESVEWVEKQMLPVYPLVKLERSDDGTWLKTQL